MKILFVHSGDETFVQLDHQLLEESNIVEDLYAIQKFPVGFFKLVNKISKSDIVYCWFASWNSFWALLIARLCKKKSILVIGGYDIANLPEIGYGSQRGGVKKWVSRLAINLASVLITNSYYSQKEAFRNVGISPDRINVIYHGVPDLCEGLVLSKENLVLTVGNIDHANLFRKGLEPFVRSAALLPELQFVLVGSWKDDSIQYLKSIASSNVLFTGFISDEELLDFYKKASVYVQASAHEGFGMSVAEAMLAGCIPVVTHAGALPEVVGDCGFYCETNSPEEIAKKINSALNSPFSLRRDARSRILETFAVNKRQKLLETIIYSISSDGFTYHS